MSGDASLDKGPPNMQRHRILICFLSLAFAVSLCGQTKGDEVSQLVKWLAQPVEKRGPIAEQSFAKQPISKKQAEMALELLWADHIGRIKKQRKDEWDKKVIKLDKLEMKFDFKVFGKKPKNGRSLFISMHGGGGAPKRVNDQQWRNQIRLYEPKEGVYLAPRAPTDTWNLWHQSHIDEFFTRIIENAIVFEGVDPNRVYIMGYSAGGDGVYQLAPRMADQLAAAAMMAGHPNNAQPDGLRNIGFALYMGGKDAAYSRNKKAAEWKEWLEKLKKADPDGYVHQVVIYPKYGHWMNREDRVAVPWMAKFTRDPFPKKIVWKQSGTTHSRFYWIAVDKENRKGGTMVVASRNDQTINIEKTEGLNSVNVRLNDAMIDFDKPVQIKVGDRLVKTIEPKRNILSIFTTLAERGDPKAVYSFETSIDLGEKR